MQNIGFVTVCHEDYLDDNVKMMAGKAVTSLAEKGIAVYTVKEPVLDVRGAEKAGTELVQNGVDGVILFLGSWIECPVAMSVVREVEHLPMCLWGFPMFMDNGALSSTGSYVAFAMFKGTMDRVRYKYKPVLGLPDDEGTVRGVFCFCKAAAAMQRLKRARIGLVGYTSMSIYPGTFDHVFLRAKIGPEVDQIDSYTIINTAESIPEDECREVIDYLRNTARIHKDVTENDLIKVSKLYLALKKAAEQRYLHGMNVKCQYEFSKEYKMVMCVPLSILAESGIVASCEGDMLNTVSMMILHFLSGQTVTYGDVMNHEDNVVKLSSCGFIPFSFGDESKREIRKFFPHPGFNGIQNSFVLKPGKVTVMRLVEDQCDYHFVYMTGEGLETELRQGYMPALDVKLDGDMKRFVTYFSGQHYAICYGDLSRELEELAAILGIEALKI